MVYLDSNVFLYAALYDASASAKARFALRTIREATEGKIRATSSLLTWDEVVWVTWRLFGKERALKVGSIVLRLTNVKFIGVNRGIILKAEEICHRYGVGPRDAIHVATAIVEGEKENMTEDKEFDKVPKIKRIPLRS